MSTGASQRNPGDGPLETDADLSDADAAPPLDPDRPYVDGSSASPEELRAEVERLRLDERQHVDDLREEVGDSVAELAARLDVKSRVTGKKDEAVATVHDQVARARTAVAEGATAAKDTARQRPGALGGAAAALAALLVLAVVALRRRRG
jgi:hypothetical protein